MGREPWKGESPFETCPRDWRALRSQSDGKSDARDAREHELREVQAAAAHGWSSTTDLREIGGFLLSEDILKAGNYDYPLQKYRKRKYIKPLYSLSTHAQSSMNPRDCEM